MKLRSAKTAKQLNGRMPIKKFVLFIESWIFTFFQILFLLIVLHDIIFNAINMHLTPKGLNVRGVTKPILDSVT
jgi:hypothetical protein